MVVNLVRDETFELREKVASNECHVRRALKRVLHVLQGESAKAGKLPDREQIILTRSRAVVVVEVAVVQGELFEVRQGAFAPLSDVLNHDVLE